MIRLRLLGPPGLDRDDDTAVRSVLAQPKRFAVLAYLAASHPQRERSRDTLLGLFWPDLDDRHARKALRQSLYDLRRSLGRGALTGKGRELVGVDPERVWCDAAHFSAAVDEGRDEEALDLYGGPFLEGFHLSETPEFERWVEVERRRLVTQAQAAARRLAESAEKEAERTEARRWAERALELAPYDGEGVRRYMSLMERLGQPAAAVRAYEAYAGRLAADLDLRPSADTTALVERIRNGGDGPRPAPGRARGLRPGTPGGAADGASSTSDAASGSLTDPVTTPDAAARPAADPSRSGSPGEAAGRADGNAEGSHGPGERPAPRPLPKAATPTSLASALSPRAAAASSGSLPSSVSRPWPTPAFPASTSSPAPEQTRRGSGPWPCFRWTTSRAIPGRNTCRTG